MDEIWDVFDENHQRTGKTILRHQRDDLKKGEYHQVVCILIINKQHQVLIQKRSASKENWPDIWADTGGAALAGETSAQAIIREVEEEIGIRLEADDLNLLISQKVHKHIGYFRDVYIAHKDFSLEDCILDQEEVADVMWATMDQIETFLKRDNFLYLNDSYMPMFRAYMDSL